MSDEIKETTEAVEAPAAEKPFFKVVFLDIEKGEVDIQTNLGDPRNQLNQLMPIIEHLRRQGVLLEIAAMQQAQAQRAQVGLIRQKLAGKGLRGGL